MKPVSAARHRDPPPLKIHAPCRCSSVGQSVRLIRGRSGVRCLAPAPIHASFIHAGVSGGYPRDGCEPRSKVFDSPRQYQFRGCSSAVECRSPKPCDAGSSPATLAISRRRFTALTRGMVSDRPAFVSPSPVAILVVLGAAAAFGFAAWGPTHEQPEKVSAVDGASPARELFHRENWTRIADAAPVLVGQQTPGK